MKIKKINEDCGCGGKPAPEARIKPVSKNLSENNVGKMALLVDGRQALVDDSIKNSSGEVIGYVLTNERGAFRVFKDKVQNFYESEGAMSSLSATIGQGNVVAPTSNSLGSGDKFPTIGGGNGPVDSTPKQKKDRKKNQFTNNLLDFTAFSKKMKGFQQSDKTNKK